MLAGEDGEVDRERVWELEWKAAALRWYGYQ
jgi:hypothetical protein